ncbi:hypothetical protein ACFOU2_15705 [Bacillus songklensis]|uniref:Uncharacterized protein n=1 Tax=Bacillus songklensis TaxID=1069116 RepID=A0ABV8B3L3_9BACI
MNSKTVIYSLVGFFGGICMGMTLKNKRAIVFLSLYGAFGCAIGMFLVSVFHHPLSLLFTGLFSGLSYAFGYIQFRKQNN